MSRFLALLPLLAGLVRADCYSRDGKTSFESKVFNGPELVSCGNSTNNCCLPGQRCGTNLLCISDGGAISREYCASQSWDRCSAACSDGLDAGRSMKEFPPGSNTYCCGKCECETGPLLYVDPLTGVVEYVADKRSEVRPIWWAVDSSSLLRSTASPTSSSSSATPSSSVATTSFLSSTTVSSTTLPTSTPAGGAAPSSPSLSPGASAGIGVGGTVVVVGIAMLVWLFIRERRKRRSFEDQMSQSQAAPAYYSNGYPPFSPGEGVTKENVAQVEAQPYGLGSRQELEHTQRHEMS